MQHLFDPNTRKDRQFNSNIRAYNSVQSMSSQEANIKPAFTDSVPNRVEPAVNGLMDRSTTKWGI